MSTLQKLFLPMVCAVACVAMYLFAVHLDATDFGLLQPLMLGKRYDDPYGLRDCREGLVFLPWFKVYVGVVAFVALGTLTAILRRRDRSVLSATRPWLLGGMLICVMAGIGVIASWKLRMVAIGCVGWRRHQIQAEQIDSLYHFAVGLGLGLLAAYGSRLRSPRSE